MRKSTIYFIAALLFGLVAALTINEEGGLTLGGILQLIAAAAFAILGTRSRRSKA